MRAAENRSRARETDTDKDRYRKAETEKDRDGNRDSSRETETEAGSKRGPAMAPRLLHTCTLRDSVGGSKEIGGLTCGIAHSETGLTVMWLIESWPLSFIWAVSSAEESGQGDM